MTPARRATISSSAQIVLYGAPRQPPNRTEADAQSAGSARRLSPLDRPRCETAGGLRRALGLIVASLASHPPITVYWDGMPR